MRVTIGPYLDYWGPFQIAEKLTWFLPEQKDEYGFKKRHDWSYALGHFFAYGTFDEKKADKRTKFNDLCEWIYSKRKRTVKIKIDHWDSWNAHNTISMIALPIMRDLRDTKQGHGFIDDEDVPEYLQSKNAETPSDENGNWDSNAAARYDWVLNEVIWALEQDQPDCDWESQYTEVEAKLDLKTYPEDEGKKFIPVRWEQEGKYDWDGMKLHQERINNGLRLFGKYYQTFWS